MIHEKAHVCGAVGNKASMCSGVLSCPSFIPTSLYSYSSLCLKLNRELHEGRVLHDPTNVTHIAYHSATFEVGSDYFTGTSVLGYNKWGGFCHMVL